MLASWHTERASSDRLTKLMVSYYLDRLMTENETPLLRYSIYFYDRTTYIVITAEHNMKPVSECAEAGLQSNPVHNRY